MLSASFNGWRDGGRETVRDQTRIVEQTGSGPRLHVPPAPVREKHGQRHSEGESAPLKHYERLEF